VITRLEQRHRRGEDRRHARRGGDAGFGALERGEPVLEHRYRGIGEARIDEALLPAREARGGLRRAVEHEARREEQGLGMFLELGASLPGTHTQGRKLERVCHGPRPCLRAPEKQKPGQADRVSSARFSCIFNAPASCGSNRRERHYTKFMARWPD
jgi:hypothetical protein